MKVTVIPIIVDYSEQSPFSFPNWTTKEEMRLSRQEHSWNRQKDEPEESYIIMKTCRYSNSTENH